MVCIALGLVDFDVGADMCTRERQNWRCSHCKVWGSAVWAVRDGPNGPRVGFFPSVHCSSA